MFLINHWVLLTQGKQKHGRIQDHEQDIHKNGAIFSLASIGIMISECCTKAYVKEYDPQHKGLKLIFKRVFYWAEKV